MGDPIRAYLMRPTMCDPPLCTLSELKTTLTVDDLADFHEALNIKEANNIKRENQRKRKR